MGNSTSVLKLQSTNCMVHLLSGKTENMMLFLQEVNLYKKHYFNKEWTHVLSPISSVHFREKNSLLISKFNSVKFQLLNFAWNLTDVAFHYNEIREKLTK